MEEARQHSIVSMRHLVVALIIFGLSASGYWLLSGSKKDAGPLADMRARYLGLVFSVVESKVVTLGGMDRFEVTLEPIQGNSQSVNIQELVTAACGSILTAKTALDKRGLARDRVFQIAVQVILKDDEPAFNIPLPVSVRDGACQPDVLNDEFYPRYPPPVEDYILYSLLSGDGAVTVKFLQRTDKSLDLDDFDFLAACNYVMQDPPTRWSEFVSGTPARVVIEAEKQVGNSFLGANWSRGREYVLAGKKCVVPTGAPT